MFHRVKSEVQVAGQESTQESDNVHKEDARRSSPSNSKLQDKAEIREGNSYGRSYLKSQEKAQEETNMIKSREETSTTTSKYSRDAGERSSETPRGTAYQPSVSRPSSGYATSSSYAAPHSPEAYSGNDRTLTIGRGINMSGEIDACDRLMVEGTVEAALKGAKILEIADTGVFYGTVEIEEATIAGRFEGDITANGRLTIKSTGIVTGSIAYRELEVESGAVLDGRMTPIKGNVDPKSVDRYRSGSDASTMAKTKEVPSKKGNREPANTESGLFSKAHTTY